MKTTPPPRPEIPGSSNNIQTYTSCTSSYCPPACSLASFQNTALESRPQPCIARRRKFSRPPWPLSYGCWFEAAPPPAIPGSREAVELPPQPSGKIERRQGRDLDVIPPGPDRRGSRELEGYTRKWSRMHGIAWFLCSVRSKLGDVAMPRAGLVFRGMFWIEYRRRLMD